MPFALDFSRYPLNREIVCRLLVRPVYASNSCKTVETVFTVIFHHERITRGLEKVRPAFSCCVIVHCVLNKFLKIYSCNNNSIQVVSVLLSDLVLFQIWDFNGHCHHILMAGNGDPAEISQVLCLKRIIIVVGWDRYVQMSLTILSLLL